MFKQVISLLLSGEFICPFTHQDAYTYLGQPNHQTDINAWIEKMDLKLATTRHEAAFFCTTVNPDSDDKKAIRENFRQIKQTLRPLVSFLELLMRITQRDDILSAGTLLEANVIMHTIDTNPSLRNELQSLCNLTNITAESDRKRLDKLLKYIEKEGYLVLVNSEREIYRMTGKIDYLMEVIAFLMEHETISELAETDIHQMGTLL